MNRDFGSPVPGRGKAGRGASVWATLACLTLALALVACPIQRPLLPESYPGFRYDLELAVRDTAAALLAERPDARRRLEARLTELSSLAVVDSLVSRLRFDPRLEPLGAAVEAAVAGQLASDGLDGDVRKAFETPPGQRLASDAIIVGLGRALHLTRGSEEAGEIEGEG